MTEREQVPASEEPTQEQHNESASEQTEAERMVPLKALEETRRKLRELEQKNEYLTERVNQNTSPEPKQPDVDPEEWVTYGSYKSDLQKTLQQKSEADYLEYFPDRVKEINESIEKILADKPYLRTSIENSSNRFATAWKIVSDEKKLDVRSKVETQQNSKKLEENQNKPGSPTQVGKQGAKDNTSYLKSIAGTSEFRDYRKKLLSRR